MNTYHHLVLLQDSDLTALGRRLVKEALAAVKHNIASDETADKVAQFNTWWTSTYQDPFKYARLKANMHLITLHLIEMLSADYLELPPQRQSNYLADICRVSADPESPSREELIQLPLQQLDLDALHVERRLQRLAGQGFLKTIEIPSSLDTQSNLPELLERDLILLRTLKERGAIKSQKYGEIARGIASAQNKLSLSGANMNWLSRLVCKHEK